MRRPLHDTPQEYRHAPAEALAADVALLDRVRPGGPWAERWYVVDRPAVEVHEARADVAAARERGQDRLLDACFGALSPHEVVVGSAKLVGFAQVRRKHAALFQTGVLLRDQSALAEFMRVPDETSRRVLREALNERTVGLADLV